MIAPTRLRSAALAAFLLAGFSASSARAGEHYFVLIFGSQSSPKVLSRTHTWATFVKAVGEGPDLSTYALEVNTISWLPASLDVRVWNPRPEKGVNFELRQTLNYVYSEGESVTMWGPFVIGKPIYERSVRVRQVAESGAAQYRAISNSYDMLISDCIHAVAAVDPVLGRSHYPLIRIGKPASRYIARQIMTRSLFDQYQYDNSWLIARLGLCRYPIQVVAPRAIPKRGCVLCKLPD
ncbi:MAG: hypothetical protein JWN86_562 [Planctomycetota bacterium]|nr:hypothetical protein [Planctomycetota bacterium]